MKSFILLMALWFVVTPLSSFGQDLSLDKLMADTSQQAHENAAVTSSRVSSSMSVDPTAPSLDLSTIEAGRAALERQKIYQILLAQDTRIQEQCNCNSSSCFGLDGRYDNAPIREAASEAAGSLKTTLTTLCGNWAGPGEPDQSLSMLQKRRELASKFETALGQIDNSAQDIRRQLKAKDVEATRLIAAQKEAANPGFNWGQFTAMAVGVVAGGAADLSLDQQAQVLSAITLDSMNGGGDMSNLQGTLGSLTNELKASQAQLQTPNIWNGVDINAPAANLAFENQRITDAANDLANIVMGKEVDISNRSYAVAGSNATPSLDALMGDSVSNSSGAGQVTGSVTGFDPAMRSGGATSYDAVGNSSGIQGTTTAGSDVASRSDTVVNETFRFTCPSGTESRPIPIVADSRACADAMKRFAKVYSCNLFEEFETAQLEMNRLCASNMFAQ